MAGSDARLRWAQELAGVAQNGLNYSENAFDRARYAQVRRIAAALLAAMSADPDPGWAQRLLAAEEGHATPKVDVRAVVVRDGRALFVKERSDGAWTLPGGWADPGDAPSTAVEREVREEAGLTVRATKLLACLERSRHGHLPPYPFTVYKLFFLCEALDPAAEPGAGDGLETAAAGWFDLASPPPLSLGRIMPAQLRTLAAHLADPHRPADFD